MVELVELIQIALRDGAPLAISAVKDAQREKHIEKLEKIQNETYERMLSKLKEEEKEDQQIVALKEKSQALLERINKLKESCPSCQRKSPKETVGNRTWQLLHATASVYPLSPTEEDKQRVKQFVDSVVYNLPCQECSEHAKRLLIENPLDYSSRASLERSLCQFHDQINQKLNKPTHGCS